MEIVTDLSSALLKQIGQDRFELWFGDVQFDIAEDRLNLIAAKPFLAERLRKTFLTEIRAAVSEVFQTEMTINFSGSRAPADPLPKAAAEAPPEPAAGAPVAGAALAAAAGGSSHATPAPQVASTAVAELPTSAGLRRLAPAASTRQHRFQQLSSFIEGECNRLALTAVRMIIEGADGVSPLLIHGPAGTGKTHLLEGLWCQLRKSSRRSRIVFLAAEQFTTLFLEALRGDGLPNFRRKYRHVDVLLIDDLQFFRGKKATIMELVYTMDVLLRAGRHVVLSADRPQADLADLSADLSARLSGGLACGLQPLDRGTRLQVLRRLAQRREMTVPEAVLETIAKRTGGDARQLSGVLNRLRAHSQALRTKITPRMADEVVDELLPTGIRIIRLAEIERIVCDFFALQRGALQADARTRAVSHPRMLAMWLARKYTSACLTEISEYFGRRSHSTVVSAEKTVRNWLQQGAQVRLGHRQISVSDVVFQLEEMLKAA